jgi:hypothetical protein
MSKTFKCHKGGGFTGNQLRDLFGSGYEGDIELAKKSLQIELLEESDPQLCNDKFRAYYSTDKTQPRFIAIHNGTVQTVRDWGNNLRNTFGLGFFNNKLLTTNRNTIARMGHEALVRHLINLYNNRKNDVVETKKYIIELIEKKISSINTQITSITVDEAVAELLKEYLSTIGHSQGAIYAYLYGNIGKETIVYNPAPYHGKKPDNTYILRRKGDVVSFFTNANDNRVNKITELDKLKGKNAVEQHTIETLDNMSTFFGNKFLYNKDIEVISKQTLTTPEDVIIVDTPKDLATAVLAENVENVDKDLKQSDEQTSGGAITRRSRKFKLNKSKYASKKQKQNKNKTKTKTKKRKQKQK